MRVALVSEERPEILSFLISKKLYVEFFEKIDLTRRSSERRNTETAPSPVSLDAHALARRYTLPVACSTIARQFSSLFLGLLHGTLKL